MKNNICLIIFSAFIFFSLSGCMVNEKKISEKDINNTSNEKAVVRIDKFGEESDEFSEVDYDYKVIGVIKKEDYLVIHVEAELEDTKAAFHMGNFITDSMKLTNSEKLKEDNVNGIRVFFNGIKKDFYFDGVNEVKEISQNWGE